MTELHFFRAISHGPCASRKKRFESPVRVAIYRTVTQLCGVGHARQREAGSLDTPSSKYDIPLFCQLMEDLWWKLG